MVLAFAHTQAAHIADCIFTAMIAPVTGVSIEPLPPLPALSAAQVAGLNDPDLMSQCIVEAPLGSRLRRIGLGLSGMYCAACAMTIEGVLRAVPGVSEVQVQSATQRARILLDPARVQMADLVAAVQAVGYQAWPDGAARAGHERLRERRKLTWRLSVAAFCMMQVMMITLPQYVAGPGAIPPDLWNLMNWACWVLSLPVMLFSCRPFFEGAWRAAMQGRVAMDTPVAVGIAATFITSTGAAFGGQAVFGHEVYFDSLTMFVTFLLAGRWLEGRAREKVTESLESLCVRLPEAVDRLAADGAASHPSANWTLAPTESVPLSALARGDRVRIALGQAFPADGQILHGQTEVDEALLTGESRAVAKSVGQLVVAGSVNLGSPVWMSIERLGPETRYQQIVSLVHQAMTDKPGWMRQADRLAGPFLWGVLLLAGAGALGWHWIDPSRAVWVAVSVLVVTCPCALSLAAPSALLAAAGALGKRGVLVRRLDALEALAHVDHVYFDKTGTLTEPELRVTQVWTLAGAWPIAQGVQAEAALAKADQDLWRSMLSLAALSQHPLSQSLVKATSSGFQPMAWHDAKELAGKGIQAQDDRGWVWRLGGRDWVLEGEVGLTSATEARVWIAARDGRGMVVRQTLMAVALDESIRAEAPEAIQGIQAQGCKAWMLSGDHAERVASAAALLGQGTEPMAVAQAHASPEDKLRVITQAQSNGHTVAVVGDGINDAPVLAQAQVSIALDQGAALAQSQADLIILGGRLTGVPYAIALSRQTQRVVRQNLAWAAVYNLACIPLALLGYLPPWLAGLGMALSSLGVVLNALRLGAFRA